MRLPRRISFAAVLVSTSIFFLTIAEARQQDAAIEDYAPHSSQRQPDDSPQFADPEALREAARRGVRRAGPRGIDVPGSPPDALTPIAPGTQILSVTVRDADGRRTRLQGTGSLSLQLQPSVGPAGADLDLDITAKPFDHTHRVSGQFQVQFPVRLLINAQESPMWPWKAAFSTVNQTAAISNAIVVLTDECGHYIRGETDNSGAFSFDWTPAGCDLGEVTVWSVSDDDAIGVGRWNNGPIANVSELTAQTPDYRAYSFTQTFDIGDAEDGLDLGTITVPVSDDAARGFYIMDNVQRARAYYDSLPGVSAGELSKINVEHTEGLKPDGVSCNEDSAGGWGKLLGFAFYSPGIDPGFIHIPWDCNDLGLDGHAVVHETAHYFHRHFLRQEDPDYGRFGEGMANLQAALIRNTQWMTTAGAGLLENLDVNSRMACWDAGQWDSFIDDVGQREDCIDDGGTPGFPQAATWNDNLASAGWFQRIVYDMTDGGAGDSEALTRFIVDGQSPDGCGNACEFGQFDQVNGGSSSPASALALNDVLIFYLGGDAALGTNPNYVDRGLSGLDIVDVLDGFICRGHADAEDVSEIIVTAMGLDYDASGAPDSCAHPAD